MPRGRDDTREVIRSITLGDADWSWASWRAPRPRPPLPPPPHFAIAASCKLLAENVRVLRSKKEWDFSGAGLHAAMARDEARFWVAAMVGIEGDVTPAQRAKKLARKLPELPTLATIAQTLARSTAEPPPELPLVLAAAFSPLEVALLVLESKPPTDGEHAGGTFVHGFHEHVLPLLGVADLATLRARVAPFVTVEAFTLDHYEEPHGAFFLAAMLGLHELLEPVLASFSDVWYRGEKSDALHVPQLLIFGLASPERVLHHMRRLGLSLHHPVFVRGWLAHTETAALDLVTRSICETKDARRAVELAEVLALVRAPETAGPMLEIAARSKAAAGIAKAWLDTEVGHAARGYAMLAVARGPLASTAAQRLKQLRAAGLAVEDVEGVDPEDATRLAIAMADRTLPVLEDLPSWLAEGLADVARLAQRPPRWLARGDLPDLEVAGPHGSPAKLGPDHVDAVLLALAASTFEEPHALALALREHATPDARDAFARRIFDAWLMAGGDAKQKWALVALGLLGADAAAVHLAPLVRVWPGEGLHQRAVLGIDALAAIGTETAVVQIVGIAQKLWFPALKMRAEAMLEVLAQARGTTRADLEDSVVPAGGFDEHGRRVLRVGDRAFEIVLGRDATPVLRDDAGVRTDDLPAPRPGDDLALYQRAATEWSTLRTGLQETFEIQAERLEQAMVQGRTWTAAAFDQRLVRHPLMSHLARTLVWAVFQGARVVATFRVAEDGTLADAEDAEYILPADAAIGIAHPLDLDEPAILHWGAVLADYEVLAPFDQIGRAVFALTEAERATQDLALRLEGKEWPAEAFLLTLRRRGWTHGDASGGYVANHVKEFPAHGLTAVLRHDLYRPGEGLGHYQQRVGGLFFQKLLGVETPDAPIVFSGRIALGNVDRRCVSEVLYDLDELAIV